MPTSFPPPIKQVIKMLVPRVNADSNEMGGVPVVVDEAPPGTHPGWVSRDMLYDRSRLVTSVLDVN